MDENYTSSLASDLFNVIQSARNADLDLDDGFSNQPLSTANMAITYSFYPKQMVDGTPGMPEPFRKRLRNSNILAAIILGGKPVGVFLLCALQKKFSDVGSVNDLLEGMQSSDVEKYALALKKALKEDLVDNVTNTPSGTEH